MKTRSSTEYVLLGALMPVPKHGYEILQFLESDLESTWHVSPSQLYALLKRMEEKGLVLSSLEAQDSRPSKRVFSLTDEGKRAFLDWLHSPVSHVRDFRVEFLGKLFFFHHLSLEGGSELIDRQIQVLSEMHARILKRERNEKEGFKKLVHGFKREIVEGRLKWLTEQAKPFMRGSVE